MDNLESLRLFTRVVERESFSAAASELGVPATTASDAIRQLEQRLGVKILERTTGRVAPTPEGAALAAVII